MNDEKEKKFGTFGVSESTPEKWKEAPCRSLHGAIAIFATLKMRGQKDQQKPCRRVLCPSLWSEGGKGRSALCAGVFSHPVCYNRRDESRRKVGNPMTLTELWDETAENVTEKVRRAQDPERCASLLEEELDHLLYRYGSSEEDGARRDLAASLLSALRMALPLLARGNRAQLWEAAPSSCRPPVAALGAPLGSRCSASVPCRQGTQTAKAGEEAEGGDSDGCGGHGADDPKCPGCL